MRRNKSTLVRATARASTVTFLALGLTACLGGGGSSSGNGGDSPSNGLNDSAANCEGEILPASDGDGLTSGGDYQGLHYFISGDSLCALDVASGTSFRVDGGPMDVFQPVMGGRIPSDPSGPLVEDYGPEGVLYINDGTLRYANTSGSASNQPTARQVSSASGRENILSVQIVFNFEQDEGAQVAVQEGDPDTGEFTWWQTPVSASDTTDPVFFDDGQSVLSALPEFETGGPAGWLVVEIDDNLDAELHKIDFDGNQVNNDPIHDAGRVYNKHTRFSDGTILLSYSESNFGQTGGEFLLYAPGGAADAGTITDLGGTPPQSGLGDFFGLGQASDGSAFFYEDEGTVYRVDDAEQEALTAIPDDANIALLIPADDHIFVGFNRDDDTNKVLRIDKWDGSSDEVLATEAVLTANVTGSGNGWVFINSLDADTLENTAYAFDETAAATERKEFQDAAWAGGSMGDELAFETGFGSQPVMEVFLVEDDSVIGPNIEANQELFVYSTSDMDDRVSLGELEQETLGPAVIGSRVNVGPHRLFTSANDVIYTSTADSDSAQTLIKVETGGRVQSILDGF